MSEIKKRRENLSLDPDAFRDYIDSYLIRGVATGNPLFDDDGACITIEVIFVN